MSMDEHMIMIHSICEQTNNVKYLINVIHVHFHLQPTCNITFTACYNVYKYTSKIVL